MNWEETNDMAIHSIELFAGVGMLGESVAAGLKYLGYEHRTVCYIEREAHAASVLVARMEEGSLDKAPIWSDVTSFDAKRFSGRVAGIIAGFPCQDISIAGARSGLDGERSGLFFAIPPIADDCGANWMFLENVSAIASATATVVDEEEGELEERAAARVLGELADLGWNAEWLTVSASDVGASHGRARWFCLAWRMDDTLRANWRTDSFTRVGGQQRNDQRRREKNSGIGVSIATLGHSAGKGFKESGFGSKRQLSTKTCNWIHHRPQLTGGKLGNSRLQYVHIQQWEIWPKHTPASCELDNTMRLRWHKSWNNHIGHEWQLVDAASELTHELADSQSKRYGKRSLPFRIKKEQPESAASCLDMAYSSGPGWQGYQLRGTYDDYRHRTKAYGPISELRSFFAPGPTDHEWQRIISENPELAPALEPAFRSMVNGLAFNMGDSRAARLKCVGNGVVALQAAAAFVVLARRANLF